MCSLVTNLMTSLEFRPIRCATMLCHFRLTRKGYVATQFLLLSNNAESSATHGYVFVPERFGQNKDGSSRIENGLGKNLILFPPVVLINAKCNHMSTWILPIIYMYLIFLFFLVVLVLFLVFSSYGKHFLSFVYAIIFCVGAGKTTPISDGLDRYLFVSKDGIDAVHEKWNGRRGAFFPTESAFFLFR